MYARSIHESLSWGASEGEHEKNGIHCNCTLVLARGGSCP